MGECSMVGRKAWLSYDNAADLDTAWTTPTLQKIDQIDITLNQSRNTGSSATTASLFEYSVAGHKTLELSFQFNRKRTETNVPYDDLRAAWVAHQPVIVVVADRDIDNVVVGETAKGVKAIMTVDDFTENFPLQDQSTVDVTVRICEFFKSDGSQLEPEMLEIAGA